MPKTGLGELFNNNTKNMFAIAIFIDDKNIEMARREDGTIAVFNSLIEADNYANQIEPNDAVRVISLDGIEA